MEILYLISVLILLISFILVKKSEKEIDVINFIVISIVTLFCYNTFVCYVLTFFTIPIKLWLLSLINIIISLIFLTKIYTKKEIQKFKFNKIDLLYIFLIVIIVIIVTYINFGFPFEVNYETGDPSAHYLTSVMFAESDSLLAGKNNIDEVYGTFKAHKTVSYVNSGLIMKCLCPDSDFVKCYNFFVIFGLIIFLLTGISVYTALKKFSKNKEHTFWAFIVSVICILGYPLNSWLFGFEYLSMGLLILSVIIDLVYYYNNNTLKFPYSVLIFSLLNFGLFSAYYMFVPFVYPALWIYFCIFNYSENKKIVTKKLIIMLTLTLLIPFFLGYIYHLMPEVYSIIINKDKTPTSDIWGTSKYLAGTGIANRGYIYVNIYSNILLLLPLSIYYFYRKIKDKKIVEEIFLGLIFTFAILFILLLLIGNYYEKVSMYYLSKNYFALWIILAFTNYKALILIFKKNKYISRLFIYSYIFLMIVCTIFSNVKVEFCLNNPYENILSVMEIFGANKTLMLDKPREYTKDELEILKYVSENLDYNKKIEFVTDENSYYWQYVLLRYINKEEKYLNRFGGYEELIYKLIRLEEKINNVDYIVYFTRTKKYNELKDKLFENAEIIYQNESGGILKYNIKE